MKKYIYLTFISVLCFILGFLSFSFLENFVYRSFIKYNLTNSQMNTMFLYTLAFAIICGISPIMINSIWRKTKVEKSKPKVISILLLLLAIVIFVAIRYSLIASELDFQKSHGFSTLINVEDLNLPLNIFLGEILGLLVMYVFLKRINSQK